MKKPVVRPALEIDEKTRTAIKADGTRIPVVDSKFTFLITPSKEDIDLGVPGDYTQCMYCRAFRRAHESELVWVTRSVAYAEIKGKGGKPILERFILTAAAKDNIKAFDAEEQLTPEAVIFSAPAGSQCLDAIEEKNKANAGNKKARRKKAFIVGDKPAGLSSHAKSKLLKPAGLTLREKASGRFQFKKSADC
jgi:hypothetical protein